MPCELAVQGTSMDAPASPRPGATRVAPPADGAGETSKGRGSGGSAGIAGTAAIAGIAVVGAWVVIAAILAARLAGMSLDDFYITYRYALHLAHGQGFVFNPGERIFGLTNPGLALLLAAAAWLTRVPVPALATAVSGGALVILAGLLLRSAARTGRFVEAAGAGTLAVTSSYLWALQGGEGLPMLALLAGAAELAAAHPLAAGALAGMAVWFRPEAALGAGLLCLLVWRQERRMPWQLAGAAGLVVALGLAAAALYFRTPIPSSLAAKQAMAAAGVAGAQAGPVRFWLRSVRLVAHHFGPLWPLLVALGLAGLAPLYAAGGRAGKLLVLFALALAVFYPLSGVPWFPWYTLPVVVALLYGMAFALGAVVRWGCSGRWGRWRRWSLWGAGQPRPRPRPAGAGRGRRPVLATLLALALAAPIGVSLAPACWGWHRAFDWPPFMRRYRAAGQWLAGHTPPGASVAYYEVGALGYWSDRTVVDLLGIVTPALLPYVRQGDLAGAFLARPADYAVFDTARGGLMPVAAAWFQAAYAPVARFGELTIFARRPGVALPPPAAPVQSGAPPRHAAAVQLGAPPRHAAAVQSGVPPPQAAALSAAPASAGTAPPRPAAPAD